jgi:hypothetical protein
MSNLMDDIFGEPALLEGEDSKRYLDLYAAVEAEIQPKNIFDRIEVRELTDKIWEELRYKRSSAALIDSAYVEALGILLTPVYVKKVSVITAGQAAVNYYSDDSKAKKEVAAVMAQHGITDAKVQAKAMQIIGGTLQLFDRMIAHRQNARRSLRKEKEKREATNDARSPADLEKST